MTDTTRRLEIENLRLRTMLAVLQDTLDTALDLIDKELEHGAKQNRPIQQNEKPEKRVCGDQQ